MTAFSEPPTITPPSVNRPVVTAADIRRSYARVRTRPAGAPGADRDSRCPRLDAAPTGRTSAPPGSAGALGVLPADLVDAADGWSAAGGGVRAPAVVEADER